MQIGDEFGFVRSGDPDVEVLRRQAEILCAFDSVGLPGAKRVLAGNESQLKRLGVKQQLASKAEVEATLVAAGGVSEATRARNWSGFGLSAVIVGVCVWTLRSKWLPRELHPDNSQGPAIPSNASAAEAWTYVPTLYNIVRFVLMLAALSMLGTLVMSVVHSLRNGAARARLAVRKRTRA